MIGTENRQAVTYFIGTEVENTAMKGQKTLFVVGVQPVKEIKQRADKDNIKHLYFGTSQSYVPETQEDVAKWAEMIEPLLKDGYWCTLDFDVMYTECVHESNFDSYNNFIAMISVKIPNIKLLNYNATLKIDDTTWGLTNPGVWCHPLNELLTRTVYTDWRDYVGDTPID
jgi:hypothetical protein